MKRYLTSIMTAVRPVGTTIAALTVIAGCLSRDSVAWAASWAFIGKPSIRIPLSMAAPSAQHFFVSSGFNGGFVDIFDIDGNLDATLTGFNVPEGLAVDSTGDLYVADQFNGRVQVYASPYDEPPVTLRDSGMLPMDVAVDRAGNVAVTAAGRTGPSAISFYAKGATSPTNVVSNPSFDVFCDAFDAEGNLYVDGRGKAGTLVGVVVGGLKCHSIAMLTTGNAILDPGGIAVTRNGLIAIYDADGGPAIYTYNPPNPHTGSLGEPIATTQLEGESGPTFFAFTPDGKGVLLIGPGGANLYAYPSGGQPIETVHAICCNGVAIYPPAPL